MEFGYGFGETAFGELLKGDQKAVLGKFERLLLDPEAERVYLVILHPYQPDRSGGG